MINGGGVGGGNIYHFNVIDFFNKFNDDKHSDCDDDGTGK